MATARLIPSTYSLSNTGYFNVSNASNCYANVDSTDYATFQTTSASTSSRYVYLKGFNFNTIPDGAIVSSFTIKVRGYETGANVSATYAPILVNNTSTISGVSAASSNFSTSTNTITVPTGNLSWSDIITMGANCAIRLDARRNARNTASYLYIYGAEINVTYSMPVYYDITASTDTGTISPSGTTQVLEGNDFTLIIEASSPTVTDNNVDVTTQLVQVTGGTTTSIPYDYTNSGFTVSNIANAYADATSNTSATLNLAGRTTGNLYLDLTSINLPSSATIVSVSCQATLQFSRNGSSSSVTSSCQLYSGTTAKGTATTIVSSATDVAKTTFNLTPGNWTVSELENARFYLTMYNGASSTQRIMYVYGVSFIVTYTISGEVYTYTITNVTANHTIVVSAGVSQAIYFNNNGSWIAAIKAYKKLSGAWVLQNDLTTVFDSNTNYQKG